MDQEIRVGSRVEVLAVPFVPEPPAELFRDLYTVEEEREATGMDRKDARIFRLSGVPFLFYEQSLRLA